MDPNSDTKDHGVGHRLKFTGSPTGGMGKHRQMQIRNARLAVWASHRGAASARSPSSDAES